jgi:hypothetical protein
MESDIITLQDIFIFKQTGVYEGAEYRGSIGNRHHTQFFGEVRRPGKVIPDEFT